MAKYVCIGCRFESNDDEMAGEPCPYCGEYMAEEARDLTLEIEEAEAI